MKRVKLNTIVMLYNIFHIAPTMKRILTLTSSQPLWQQPAPQLWPQDHSLAALAASCDDLDLRRHRGGNEHILNPHTVSGHMPVARRAMQCFQQPIPPITLSGILRRISLTPLAAQRCSTNSSDSTVSCCARAYWCATSRTQKMGAQLLQAQ